MRHSHGCCGQESAQGLYLFSISSAAIDFRVAIDSQRMLIIVFGQQALFLQLFTAASQSIDILTGAALLQQHIEARLKVAQLALATSKRNTCAFSFSFTAQICPLHHLLLCSPKCSHRISKQLATQISHESPRRFRRQSQPICRCACRLSSRAISVAFTTAFS